MAYLMSRFFRSATSTSSSDTDSDSGNEDELDEVVTNASASNDNLEGPDGGHARNVSHLSTASDEAAAPSRLARDAGSVSENRQTIADHRDILLHALLEERCLNETLASHDRPQHSCESPEVQAQARAQYQRISTQLASLNLISSGLANDHYAKTRQTYRTGLDFLSRNTTAAGSSRLRRLLTDSETGAGGHRLADNESFAGNARDVALHPPGLPYPLRRLITGTDNLEDSRQSDQLKAAARALQHDSHVTPEAISSSSIAVARNGFLQPRYARDFEELSMLGKGGYGVVYRARHRLDNQSYAIKKVPLSANRLRRVENHGSSEVEEVLRELRTLAQLDHPNIVRYHTSWIEWTEHHPNTRLTESSLDSGMLSSASDDAVIGALNDRDLDVSVRLATTSRSEQLEIVFEESPRDTSYAVIGANPGRGLNSLTAEASVADATSKSNSTAEPVIRDSNQANGVGSQHQTSSESTLVLHMQMSLHPMTLADYLTPVPVSSNPDALPRLSHCFHLEPSVSILQAILNGVEYLHDKGMIHRDIKPANIFIGMKSGSEAVHGLTCSHCRAQRKATLVPLDVRIGDFGLVTLGHSTQAVPSSSKGVGTELYRSTAVGMSNSQLDIYALGIVAFELLWQFETRMERVHVIKQLKEGQFPQGFSGRLGTHGESVIKCIRSMISPNGTSLSIRGIKQVLADLQKTLH